MRPSIEQGYHVLINTAAYDVHVGPMQMHLRAIDRGDIVAFERDMSDRRRMFLKRVIALPGDRVEVVAGRLIVNGQPLRETYATIAFNGSMPETTVPPESLFLVGDNRADSDDSRSFGPVPQTAILGKAAIIIWPLNRVQRIH